MSSGVWAKKLLCSLAVWQQIILYLLTYGSRVNKWRLGHVFFEHSADTSLISLMITDKHIVYNLQGHLLV